MACSTRITPPLRWSWLLAVVAAALTCGARPATAEISVNVDGKPLPFPAAKPAMIGGRVMVPMRAIFEALGAEVKWEAATQGIAATRGTTRVHMAIGSHDASVDDRKVHLDQPPLLVGGSTMVPLRFVGEALGATVAWADSTQTVTITSPPAAAGFRIDTVTHDAVAPLRAGNVLRVTVTGTAGATGTFAVAQLPAAQRLPLTEDRQRPGTYAGSYTVAAADNLFKARVTARLVKADGEEASRQSAPLTLDNVAPRIDGTFPLNGAALDAAQPTLTLFASDIGGSGVVAGRFEITCGGSTTPVAAVFTPPSIVSAVAPRALAGAVSVKAIVTDAAGNEAVTTFGFTAGVLPGAIHTLTHNAKAPLAIGSPLVVEMKATRGGKAAFQLLDDQAKALTPEIPMPEVSPGLYRMNAGLRLGQPGQRLSVVGAYTDPAGRRTTATAAAPIVVAAPPKAVAVPFAVSAPKNKDKVGSPLTISGTAPAGATVEVKVRAEGQQKILFVTLPYSTELETKQVQANAAGQWTTTAYTLPVPEGARNLTYTVTCTRTDAAGKSAAPVTLVVTPR